MTYLCILSWIEETYETVKGFYYFCSEFINIFHCAEVQSMLNSLLIKVETQVSSRTSATLFDYPDTLSMLMYIEIFSFYLKSH